MIIGACVVHNNSHIFHRALESFNDLCDNLVVIDDGSTDCLETDRYNVIEKIFKKPFVLGKIEKTEKEIERRSELWNMVCGLGKEGDWIVLLDSDECFRKKDINRLKNLMKLHKNDERINYIGTRLYNMWSETEYRVDGYWNPKFEMKRRIFKLKEGKYHPRNFNKETVECGEVPDYVHTLKGVDSICKLLHLGYITESERKRKYEFHKRVDPEGKFHLSSHIDSIIEKPTLVTLT